MSRREFAAATLAASVAPAVARAKPGAPAETPGEKAPAGKWHGPTTGVEDKVAKRSLDSLDFTLDEYRKASLKLRFKAKSRAEAVAWQKQLSAKLTSLLGGFPATRCPLNAEILDNADVEGYRRERVVFQSRPNLTVLGYLLAPSQNAPGTRAGAPKPAIVCLPGHGRGADPVAGIDDRGQLDTANKEYQHQFAVQAAQRGYVALAIEQLAFGCRRDPGARKKGLAASSCQPSAGAALLLGETMAGWRTWDVMRAIDYLQTRPEVDSKRIACMGISGGGTVTLYAAALDRRIKAAVLSGSFASYRDSIFSIEHCIDNYVPGVLHWAEMSDVAGLIAPRPLFVESGEKDDIFPVESARGAVADLRRIYTAWAAADVVGHEVFPAEHSFWGKGAFAFLEKHL